MEILASIHAILPGANEYETKEEDQHLRGS